MGLLGALHIIAARYETPPHGPIQRLYAGQGFFVQVSGQCRWMYRARMKKPRRGGAGL
jgi:hypothetical protein